MEYTKQLINKSEGKKCDICDQPIDAKDREEKRLHYSKTKRGSDIFVHKKCWDRLYGKEKTI